MTANTEETRLQHIEHRGKVPARMWRASADVQRNRYQDEIPVAILKDGHNRFYVVDAGVWPAQLDLLREKGR
jgi:hypothetical protein